MKTLSQAQEQAKRILRRNLSRIETILEVENQVARETTLYLANIKNSDRGDFITRLHSGESKRRIKTYQEAKRVTLKGINRAKYSLCPLKTCKKYLLPGTLFSFKRHSAVEMPVDYSYETQGRLDELSGRKYFDQAIEHIEQAALGTVYAGAWTIDKAIRLFKRKDSS